MFTIYSTTGWVEGIKLALENMHLKHACSESNLSHTEIHQKTLVLNQGCSLVFN